MASKLSPAVLDAVNKTVEGYPKKWTHGICAYTAILRDTGDEAKVRYDRGNANGDVCHAGLSYYDVNDPIVVNAHKKEWHKKNPEYVLWACKETPFAHAVINRDNDEQLLKHACAMDAGEMGLGGVLWMCKVIRHFTEDTHVPGFWDKLRNCGLDGLQAFIGADILDAAGGARHGCTHTSLFGYGTPKELRETYDKIRNTTQIDHMRVAKSHGYEGRTWGSLKGKKVKKPDGWGGFIEKDAPCDPKEYAALLKEIFEGDPNNVK